MSQRLSISVVLYHPDLELFRTVFQHVLAAYRNAEAYFSGLHLFLIDNGGSADVLAFVQQEQERWADCMERAWISGQGNIGYGSAHNLAIDRTDADLHLILNPDVLIEQDAFAEAVRFFHDNPDAGLLAPFVSDGQGGMTPLCKRYPSLLVLLLRGFAPPVIRRLWQSRLEAYSMQDVINDHDVYWDPPIVSGCFMFFRTAVLKELRGFDQRFFLYFEDFDLSLRASRISRLVYVPSVRIVHFGGHTATKGARHIVLFIRSALLFFHIHGWKLI